MEIKAQKREILGSKVEALREQGFIPAELYGHGVDNLHLAVPTKEFRVAYKEAGENKIINVIVDGESRPVLIHHVDIHPITDQFQTIDFYQVKMDEIVDAVVPIKFIGEAPAVKNFGGILVKAMDELKVEALPANIPSEIVIDLSTLTELNQSIYVKDIPKDASYEFLVELENVIVSVSEQEEEVVEETPVSVDQVVVETEEKKAARDAAKSAEGATK